MIIENLIELVDIESISEVGIYENSVDLSIEDDHSFVLSSGIISHNSALSAVRKCREPNLFGAFPLRGKFLNVNEMKTTDIIKNEEVKNLMGALGLKFGEKCFDYLPLSGTKIKFILDDGEIEVDLHEEILVDGKFILVKDYLIKNTQLF